MSKKPRSPDEAIYPQFVSGLRAACSPLEYLLEYVVVAVNIVVLLSQRRDSATRMQNGRMVAVAEGIANIRQAHLGEVLRERHCELAGPSDVSAAFFRVHVGYLDLVVLGDGLLDVVNCDLPVLCREEVLKRLLGGVKRDVSAVEARISDDALQRAFQFAYVRADVLGYEEGDFLRELERHCFGLF